MAKAKHNITCKALQNTERSDSKPSIRLRKNKTRKGYEDCVLERQESHIYVSSAREVVQSDTSNGTSYPNDSSTIASSYCGEP